jgi:hypothetical protein
MAFADDKERFGGGVCASHVTLLLCHRSKIIRLTKDLISVP